MGSGAFQTNAFVKAATFCMERVMRQVNIAGKRIEILLRTMWQEKPIIG